MHAFGAPHLDKRTDEDQYDHWGNVARCKKATSVADAIELKFIFQIYELSGFCG